MFRDRNHAGKLLAAKVAEEIFSMIPKNQISETVVVGVPRGGVPLATFIANTLQIPLSILASKKIGAPFDKELAIGAVSSGGVVVLNKDLEFCSKDHGNYIESEKLRLIEASKKAEQRFLEAAGIQKKETIEGKHVILVDDGIATGMTTLAAIKTLKAQGAKLIIVATPLIATHTKALIKSECDEVISLVTEHGFNSIGQYYEDFHQVADEEVIIALKAAQRKPFAKAQ